MDPIRIIMNYIYIHINIYIDIYEYSMMRATLPFGSLGAVTCESFQKVAMSAKNTEPFWCFQRDTCMHIASNIGWI